MASAEDGLDEAIAYIWWQLLWAPLHSPGSVPRYALLLDRLLNTKARLLEGA